MTFSELVHELNLRIRESDSILNGLQSARSIKKGLKRTSRKFFNDREDLLKVGYTFHFGGGDEFQFNIGEEPDNKGKPVFRFGLAFNFQASQSVPDPIGVQQLPIERFNAFIKKYPKYLSENLFWIWHSNDRTNSRAVKKIQKSEIKDGNFLFIGKSLTKRLEEISTDDLETIIDELEYLYPVYEFVQLELDSAVKLDKVARICFNDEGWVKPSGSEGKSRTKGTYEGDYGFGYEEWLFDFSKLINGYHYAALEPINKYRSKYIGEVFNIHLYTINSISKKRFWIGELKEVEVISFEETNKVIDLYKKREWYREMEDQLTKLNIRDNLLKNYTKDILFNIKFKPQNAIIYDDDLEVESTDDSIPSTRYTLLNFRSLPLKLTDRAIDTFKPPQQSDPAPKFAKNSTRSINPRITEIPHIHNRIAESLYKFLKNKGYYVQSERSSPSGGKIDMIGWQEKKATFFEIKTYPNAKACIREALGQILEYSLYPNKIRAERLVIVSQNEALKTDKEYIKHLRETLNINLEYWSFDYQKIEVTEIIK